MSDIPWGPVGFVTFKRTYARRLNENEINSPTESFEQTVDRIIKACKVQLKCGFNDEEEGRLRTYFLKLKGSVAGRFWWQLGTKTVNKLGLFSLQNCAFVTVDEPIKPFTWTMDALMLGSGVGYNIQREYVYQLPKVKKAKIVRQDTNDADFIVPDSREGWVELLRRVLEAHFVTGKGFTYSTVCVRGKGATIRGFGGVASGPEELCWGITQISEILNSRANKKIRPIDALDIMNIIGFVVVSGNVRRSSQVALGDPDDLQFIKAKRWDLGNIPKWRAMSNNSVVCNDFSLLPDEFWEGYMGNGEPYGIFNLKLTKECGRIGETQYPDPNVQGANPCQPAWATVLTPNGISTIGKIKIGDLIWSGKNWTKVSNKWSTGIKKVNAYRTTAGAFIGTENHRIVSNGIKTEVKDALSIDRCVGDTLVPSSLAINPNDVMDGLMIGDGSVHRASNNLPILFIGAKDQDYLNSEISHLIKRPRPGISENAWEVTSSITPEELCKTFDREIPNRFYFGNKNKVCGFLRGLFSANGSIAGNRVTLKASSFEVISQVQEMLSFIGISSYYTTNRSRKNKFSNGEYVMKESYDLNITFDRNKYLECIGFLQKYKMTALRSICEKVTGNKACKNTFDIKEIELISEEEVFDITVEDPDHTYWTGGCLVSNCLEQSLENYETCCLSEVFLPNISDSEELFDLICLLYRINKHSLALPCHSKETEDVVHKNMRMGIGMTGLLQATPDQLGWLKDVYPKLREYDVEYSKEKGFPTSIKLTTIKPSGTLSLLPGVTPGIHPGYSQYFIRRIRMASNISLVELCRKNGFPVEFQKNFDGSEDMNTVVVSFPCSYPEHTVLAEDMTAIDQLEFIKRFQAEWSDNAVSCTVYYKKAELPKIKKWLCKNYESNIKSVSFLLHSGHGFVQAPYEPISKEKYEEMIAKTVPIQEIGQVSMTDIEIDECIGGACPIR